MYWWLVLYYPSAALSRSPLSSCSRLQERARPWASLRRRMNLPSRTISCIRSGQFPSSAGPSRLRRSQRRRPPASRRRNRRLPSPAPSRMLPVLYLGPMLRPTSLIGAVAACIFGVANDRNKRLEMKIASTDKEQTPPLRAGPVYCLRLCRTFTSLREHLPQYRCTPGKTRFFPACI
jgi:hypothetical protein